MDPSLSAPSGSRTPQPQNMTPTHDVSPAYYDSPASTGTLGNSIFYDDPSSMLQATPDSDSLQKTIEQIQNKIERTKELIRAEQASRDSNVNEYLKLSSSADRQQQARIKQVFEKKNQKSAQNIIHYQKKLDEYQKRLLEIQEHGVKPKQTHKLGHGLRSVGGNIRDGISGMSNTVMAKPKEFAHLLRHRFGSADDLSTISCKEGFDEGSSSRSDKGGHHRNQHGSSSLPRDTPGISSSLSVSSRRKSSYGSQGKQHRKCISDDGRRSERSPSIATSNDESDEHSKEVNPVVRGVSISSSSPQRNLPPKHQQQPGPVVEDNLMSASNVDNNNQDLDQDNNQRRDGGGGDTEWKAVMQELVLHKEEVAQLQDKCDDLRHQLKNEVEALLEQLKEQKEQNERLEEQINDLIELHQHEIENIKSTVNDMEEKVQYQSEERLLDISEHVTRLETKLTSIEHQQTQQQYLNIEGLDSTDARAVMMKLLTTFIALIHFLLFFITIAMSMARPFLKTPGRTLTTAMIIIVSVIITYRKEAILEHFPYAKSLFSAHTSR